MGEQIKKKHLAAVNSVSFRNWTDEMFLTMCVLSGCDYLSSMQGLGIKTAHRLVNTHHRIERVYKKNKRIKLSLR